jgi:septum formation protein
MRKIILASKSSRRKQLLEWAELPFDVLVQDTDETFADGLLPEPAAIQIAVNKAVGVQQLIKTHQSSPEVFPMGNQDLINILVAIDKAKEGIPPILSADTMVVINNKILGKPADKNEATEMLIELSGNKHLVITGVCILYKEQEIVFADTTEVEFHDITLQQINFYVDKYQPYDKAGAYAIQEWIGVVGIKSVKGDFYNVMGLPVSRVIQQLNKLLLC